MKNLIVFKLETKSLILTQTILDNFVCWKNLLKLKLILLPHPRLPYNISNSISNLSIFKDQLIALKLRISCRGIEKDFFSKFKYLTACDYDYYSDGEEINLKPQHFAKKQRRRTMIIAYTLREKLKVQNKIFKRNIIIEEILFYHL